MAVDVIRYCVPWSRAARSSMIRVFPPAGIAIQHGDASLRYPPRPRPGHRLRAHLAQSCRHRTGEPKGCVHPTRHSRRQRTSSSCRREVCMARRVTRLKEVMAQTGLSRSTIFALQKRGGGSALHQDRAEGGRLVRRRGPALHQDAAALRRPPTRQVAVIGGSSLPGDRLGNRRGARSGQVLTRPGHRARRVVQVDSATLSLRARRTGEPPQVQTAALPMGD